MIKIQKVSFEFSRQKLCFFYFANFAEIFLHVKKNHIKFVKWDFLTDFQTLCLCLKTFLYRLKHIKRDANSHVWRKNEKQEWQFHKILPRLLVFTGKHREWRISSGGSREFFFFFIFARKSQKTSRLELSGKRSFLMVF